MSKIKALVLGLTSMAVLATTPTSASAANFPCFGDEALPSARIHDLRIMMMVGALKCRDIAPAALRSYGMFVTQRDAELTQHADSVKAGMVAQYGPRVGKLAFDDYETTLSNHYSRMRPTARNCEELGTFARMANMADGEELETLARLATRRDMTVCDISAADPYTAQAIPEPRPAVRVIRGAVPPGVAPAIEAQAVESVAVASAPVIVAQPIVSAPVVPIQEEAVVIEASADAVDLAPTSEADENARLDRAIDALDSAAAALRELKQPTQ